MKHIVGFSERLVGLRLLAGNMTGDALGEAIGMSGSTIQLWETGKRNPSLSGAIKLADYFNCSLDYLFGRSDAVLDFTISPPLPLYDNLIAILNAKGISRYRLIKETRFPKRNFVTLRNGCDPIMPTIIFLANYLKISIDYLIGRQRGVPPLAY